MPPFTLAKRIALNRIGSTSHYVTQDLDEGLNIEQDVIRISHKDGVSDLVRKGRDLERLILARALYRNAQRRVLVHGKKTIVFAQRFFEPTDPRKGTIL